MVRGLDLIDLQLFQHVAESTSITHGARRSNMSLAAASERIQGMEQALGAALLERKRRGVELTPAGSVLLRHAILVTQQIERLRGEIGDYAKGLRGRIRVLSNTIGLFEYLPKALSQFLSAHPHIDVDLEELTSREIVRMIAAGRADIGIIGGPVDPAATLETFPFAQNRLVLVVPRAHPLSRARIVNFRTALEYDFVGLSANKVLQTFVDQQAQQTGRHLKVRVRLSSFDLICQMVASAIGIAIVPEAAARRLQRSMRIRVVGLADEWAIRHLTGVVRNFESLSPNARRLIDFLRAAATS